MNSNYKKGSSGSLNNFNFDFGIGSNLPKSLNDQKNQTSSSYSSYSSTTTAQPKPAWQLNKPSWTHQPAPNQPAVSGLNGPNSVVGDIFGKSWSSTGSGSGIGIVEKNPNLFGDLVSSSLRQGNKSTSSVPLKKAAPTSRNIAFSMGNMTSSLPKTGNLGKSGASWGVGDDFASHNSSGNVNVNASDNGVSNIIGSGNRSSNLGGPAMKNLMAGSGVGIGGGMGIGNRDPFGSFVDFGSKQQAGSLNSANKSSGKSSSGGNDGFGNFQTAAKSSATAFPSSSCGSNYNDFMGSNAGSNTNIGDFGMANMDFPSQKQTSFQAASGDPLDMLFSSSSGGATTVSGGGQNFSEVDDWGLDSGFGDVVGDDSGGATMELEGLPPPPAGVTASVAKNKGMDNQKQGQYADAIKWLSWAVVLLEKTGDKGSAVEVLSCRASCYKEVGEYKKAVADCSKILEEDDANVTVLVQRALLYESMEKYKLGAEDLRTVLKVDPTNRIARSTIHRLTKMID